MIKRVISVIMDEISTGRANIITDLSINGKIVEIINPGIIEKTIYRQKAGIVSKRSIILRELKSKMQTNTRIKTLKYMWPELMENICPRKNKVIKEKVIV